MEDEIFNPNIPRVSVKSNTSNEFNIRLARAITGADDFAEEFHAFQCATKDDIVKLDIMSVGGSVGTCIMIRRAMAQCQGNILGWIGPTCASAATAIALQCDGWEVDEMSSFMIHTGSFGPGFGKSPDVVASAMHTAKMIEKFIRLVYTGFLDEAEIQQVLDGKELYFEGEELVERLEAYAEYREEKHMEEHRQMMEQFEEVLEEEVEQE